MKALCTVAAAMALALATAAQAEETFGGFAPHQDYGVGDGPREVVVADFNGDGALDLATQNATSDDIAVLLGNGDGTFGAATFYSVGDLPVTIEAADLDLDGDIDLTVANGNGVSISVLFGNGDGTFVTHQTYVYNIDDPPYPGVIMAHTMADLDGDGDTDIALITLTANLVLFMPNDGTGTFNSFQVIDEIEGFSFPVDLEPGDLDGDGDIDLLMEYGSSAMRVYLNDGDGTFVWPPDFAITGHDIMTPPADLNGDGVPDIGLNNTVNPGGYISLAMGIGDGTFGPVTTYDVNRPSGITPCDFDRDGDMDLAITSYATYNTVSIMLGNGDGTFGLPQPYATAGNPECPVAADLNGDSWPDLITVNRNADNVSVLMNLTEYQPGDLNCDGVVDNSDIPAFVLALIDPETYLAEYPDCDLLLGDVSGDGEFNNADIAAFVELLTRR